LRSLVHWLRRPFETTDVRDHLLYAMFVTGRAGLWLALAGLFLLWADYDGAAWVVGRYRWYVMVFASLAALQFVAGYFLARRGVRGVRRRRPAGASNGSGPSPPP
jgi:hypothetical protein